MPRKPIAELVAHAFGRPALRVNAYDGSTFGPADAAVRITLSSPAELSYLITAPSSLGLARAFISGELEIEGDLYDASIDVAFLGRLRGEEVFADVDAMVAQIGRDVEQTLEIFKKFSPRASALLE